MCFSRFKIIQKASIQNAPQQRVPSERIFIPVGDVVTRLSYIIILVRSIYHSPVLARPLFGSKPLGSEIWLMTL